MIAGDVVDITFNKTTKTYWLKVEFIDEEGKKKSKKHEVPKSLTNNFSEYIDGRETKIDLLMYRNKTVVPLIIILKKCYDCEKKGK